MQGTFEPWLHDTLGFIPIFGAPETTGASVFTASLILTIMIVPIIASISRDLFLAVPRDVQDGASALGATRWEVVRGVVLPSTASGVVAASLLGLGRALGEAIAVTQVIGAGAAINASLFKTGDTLASRIASQLPGAITEMHQAALLYLGVILLVIGLGLQPVRAVDRSSLRLPADGDEMTEASFDPAAPLTATGNLRRRRAFSRLTEFGATAAALFAVGVLAIVIYTVVVRGANALSFEFLVTGAPTGIAPELVGTALIVAVATVIAMPLGVLAALFLTEFASARMVRFSKLTLDLINGLPSIIIGIFVFVLLVEHRGQSGSRARWRWRSSCCRWSPAVPRRSCSSFRAICAKVRTRSVSAAGARC